MSIPISLVRDNCDDLIDAFDYIDNISSMIEERYHGDQLQANNLITEIAVSIYKITHEKYNLLALIVISFHGWNLCQLSYEVSEYTFNKKFEKKVKELHRELKSNKMIMSPKAIAKALYIAYQLKLAYYDDEEFDIKLLSFDLAPDHDDDMCLQVQWQREEFDYH
ncbi:MULTISPECIES: hypothetical protein [Cysteiniphilum]|uniref:Uncharacterized protein n=1 Tax=Cysteiniphilum litorale TaxID=2056700 RepID=A0A8J3E9Z3_9GAMM|nr:MULTISPECIES: hypothetical protein [Cysteiniphilum]GGG04899.1 hypothetical protein GCM10010995_22890 [Cysteiniphilum litorale]